MTQARKYAQTKLALAALTLAASVLPGVAHADAVAQALLNINGFTIVASNPGNVINALPAANSNLTAQLNGFPSSTLLNQGSLTPNLTVCSGAAGPTGCGSYVANTPIVSPSPPPGSFAAATVNVTGSALAAGGATAHVDSLTALKPKGDGASSGNTQLSDDFTVTLAAASSLTFDFTAQLFLRAYLKAAPDPFLSGNAIAQANWSVNIKNSSGQNVFLWSPDGTITTGAIFGGTETADAFALNGDNNLSVNSPKDFQYNSLTDSTRGNRFTANTNLLAAGTYTITVAHNTVANATIDIPEPGSLALIGLGLVAAAAGTMSRRRKAVTA